MLDQQNTESTQPELLARMKALRTPTEPEGQPEASEDVDVSEEAPESEDDLQSDELERQDSAEQTDDETDESEELTETLDGEEAAEESPDDVVYSIGNKEITLKQLAELEKGGMKDVDYTQKTQKLADERRDFEATRDTSLESLQSHIDLVTDMLDAEFAEVDWDELRDLDTGEYLKLKERKEGRQLKLDNAKSKREELLEGQRKERAIVQWGALTQSNPDWLDEGKQKANLQLITDYTKAKGWTNEDFAEVINHRHMSALLDAATLHSKQSGKEAATKTVKKAPKVVKGKRSSIMNIDRQIKEATAKLKRTGKIEDAQKLNKLKRQLKR